MRLLPDTVLAVGLAALVGLGSGPLVSAGERQSVTNIQIADAKSEAADRFFLKAVKLYRAGDLAGAVEQFELGLSIDPDNPVAHYHFAETLKDMKRNADALAHYEKAVRLGPDTTEGIMAAAVMRNLEKGIRDQAAAKQQRAEEERKSKEIRALLSTENIDRCYKNKHPKTRLQGCDALVRYYSYSSKDELYPEPTRMFGLAGALVSRASAYKSNREWATAIRDYEQVIELRKPVISRSQFQTNNATSLVNATNGLAWLHATCPDERYRSGTDAVRLAEVAVSMRPWPNHRDTLAAAYAEAGRFEDAIREQEAAIGMLNEKGKQLYLKRFQARLALYRQHIPYREP